MKRGDIVLNGYASPGYNDLHVIVGSTTIRNTSCYKTRCLFQGKLLLDTSAFSKKDNKLKVIGHVDLDSHIINAMNEARDNTNKDGAK